MSQQSDNTHVLYQALQEIRSIDSDLIYNVRHIAEKALTAYVQSASHQPTKEAEDRVKELYPGRTHKAGNFGVLIAKQRAAYLKGHQEASTEPQKELEECQKRSLSTWKELQSIWDLFPQLGGRCRDCADSSDGNCGNGLPCDPTQRTIALIKELQAGKEDGWVILENREPDNEGYYLCDAKTWLHPKVYKYSFFRYRESGELVERQDGDYKGCWTNRTGYAVLPDRWMPLPNSSPSTDKPDPVEEVLKDWHAGEIPILTHFTEEEKSAFTTGILKMCGEQLMKTFIAFELKTHMDAMFIEETSKDQYVLTFRKVGTPHPLIPTMNNESIEEELKRHADTWDVCAALNGWVPEDILDKHKATYLEQLKEKLKHL